MGHPDGAHTHGSGGGGLGTAVLVIAGAALFVNAAPLALAAAAGLLHLVLVAAAVILGLAAVGLVAFGAWRWHRYRHPDAARATAFPPGSARAAQALPRPPRAIEQPGELHLHLHGMTAEDIAAILARHQDGQA
jgi:hypothetical protein